MTHVLLVEDEADLAAAVEYNLRREGHAVTVARDGQAALEALRGPQGFELVILDVMLPDTSGVEICRQLRQTPATRHVPVMMLTAKGEEIDRVVGFEVGADDYVTKPFSVRELMLRVKALVRRAQPEASESEATTFGVLKVSPTAHRVWVQGAEVRLTALEFRLLSTFLARRGRVQSRDVLLNDVWGISAEITTRTVDTHVKRLREKIGAAGDYIETLRGVGYRFRTHPHEEAH